MKRNWKKPQIETINDEKVNETILVGACSAFDVFPPCGYYLDSFIPGLETM